MYFVFGHQAEVGYGLGMVVNLPPLATSMAAVSKELEFTSFDQGIGVNIYIFIKSYSLWKRSKGMLACILYPLSCEEP